MVQFSPEELTAYFDEAVELTQHLPPGVNLLALEHLPERPEGFAGNTLAKDAFADRAAFELFESIIKLPKPQASIFYALIEGMVGMIRYEQKQRGEVASIGVERLMLYINTRQLIRGDDVDPELLRAMKQFYSVNEPSQRVMVERLLEPSRLIDLYVGICEQEQLELQAENVRAILEHAFHYGEVEARQLLETIIQRLVNPAAGVSGDRLVG
jgi:hypothetical protein